MAICDGEPVKQSSRGQQGKGTGLQGWLKPHFGTIKVNCDVAWCSRTGMGGFGWVARDFAGILKGLDVWAISCGFESVQLEIDSQFLDGILWDIALLKQQLCAVDFLYAPRAYNNEATHLVTSFVTREGGCSFMG
ncbi:polygalacturonase [Pyrus ussuriensis x Pyrus communis]|uniref:Polygalacturonase n=1 Tax=Pyrus ussuriensis x Pyrus communis TaxID=2448454 RepID=A0A5N5HCM2_9ROSA|nr:polygalacturonase [Pyrus ussuriensis x Pyrus communis]